MTPSKVFGVCLGVFVIGLTLGVGLPAPKPADFLRWIEAAALIVTAVIIFWYTLETRELRRTGDAQLQLATSREGAIERSAQARAGLIAFALRRQVGSWLTADVEDFGGGRDPVIETLHRKVKTGAFWKSVTEAEDRLAELVEVAPTLSADSSKTLIDVVKVFYAGMDSLNAYTEPGGPSEYDADTLKRALEILSEAHGLLGTTALLPGELQEPSAEEIRLRLRGKFHQLGKTD